MVFTKETKTVSARIPEDVHADILDRCNREGCTVNRFLNCAIELAITGYSEFDFGDEDEEKVEVLRDLIRDVWVLGNGAAESEILNVEIGDELKKLSETIDSRTLSGWLSEIETMHENFIVNINKKIATDALVIGMAS